APRQRSTLFDFMPANSAVAESQPAAPDEPCGIETPPVAGDGRSSLDLFAARAESRPVNVPIAFASGEKAKAQDILSAIRVLKWVERDKRELAPAERQVLSRFAGFGPVALSVFPDPVTGTYKDASWQALGEELK